jgi:di/tricarboxylate transporter
VEPWILGSVYAAVVVALVLGVRASWAFVGGALALVAMGVLSPAEWLASATNPSLLILWLLLVASVAIEQRLAIGRLLPSRPSVLGRMQIFVGTGLISSVLNNTAVVAILIGPLRRWARHKGIAPGAVLLPMAYAATLGGVVTLIGTSTNLVLNGLVRDAGLEGLRSMDFLVPGLAVLGAGSLYLAWVGGRMALGSPEEDSATTQLPYTVETKLAKDAPEVGKSVEQAGFRQLMGLYLVELQRGTQLIAPVAPNEVLQAGDRLFFAGELSAVDELLRARTGLVLPQREMTERAHEAPLVEAMVPPGSRLVGSAVRASQFRQRLDAAIVGVRRQGERMRGRIGDIELQAGDLLVLVAGPRFKERAGETRLLYVLSETAAPEGSTLTQRAFAWGGLGALGMLAATGVLAPLAALALWLGVLGAIKWLRWTDVRRGLDPELIVTLSSALALSAALQQTGLLERGLSQVVPGLASSPEWMWIAVLLLTTTVLTNFVTNVASVVLAFPLAVTAVQGGYLDATPAMLALAFGASAAFLTPAGYATNLMVMGPGGYSARDYWRLGGGLTAIYLAVVFMYLTWIL